MTKNHPYTCCRCGYATEQKNSIRRHLFDKKKMCPTTLYDIELTDEIKNHILEFRVYHVPDKQKTLVNQINHFNIMNNFIASMDIIDKITKLTHYNNIEIIDFDKHIEDKYEKQYKRLENNQFREYMLDKEDFYEIIDDISRVRNLDNIDNIQYFNILYDTKFDELKLYESGTWENMILEKGVRKLIKSVQECYLDSYEVYLIKKIKSDSTPPIVQTKMKEMLQEYYKFIGVFDCVPYIRDKSDSEIMKKIFDPCVDNERYDIEEEFLPLYRKICDMIPKGEIQKIKGEVFNIIKRNSKKNIYELNKRVIELVNMDELFKTTLVDAIGPSQVTLQLAKI